jgi:hypothetical protein
MALAVIARAQATAVAAVATLAACSTPKPSPDWGLASASPSATLAQIYYWRARRGKLDEYNRYIRDVAEPIDHDAQQRGAFISVTTFVSRDTTTAWTHMRVFLLRDSVQLAALALALDSSGMRLEPDSAKRRMRGEYGATLREAVGSATVSLLP